MIGVDFCDGLIRSVQFLVNNQSLNEPVTGEPFRTIFDITQRSLGTYLIQAIGKDATDQGVYESQKVEIELYSTAGSGGISLPDHDPNPLSRGSLKNGIMIVLYG